MLKNIYNTIKVMENPNMYNMAFLLHILEFGDDSEHWSSAFLSLFGDFVK